LDASRKGAMIASVDRPFRAMSVSPIRRLEIAGFETHPWARIRSAGQKLRDELLAGEQFSTLYEAQVLIERWRKHYNAVRPHSSLGYRPPAPETILPPASGLAYAALRPVQMLADSRRVLT
jgi:transposase InsO family protein